MDFWANFEIYYRQTLKKETAEYFRQVPLFHDQAVPEECANASEFLCSPWVQMQLPWQPVIFHQWLVAALATFLRYEIDVINLFSMHIPDHLLQIVQRFLSLRDKAMPLIRGGFNLLSLQLNSKPTVDFDIVRCILDMVVLPLVPILDFIVQVVDRDMIGDLRKMAVFEKGEFTKSVPLNMPYNEAETFYSRSVSKRFFSFRSIFGHDIRKLEEVIQQLDCVNYSYAIPPRTEEYVEKILGYWKDCEEAFWLFLKERGSKYYDFSDLELSKELLKENSAFSLFELFVNVKMIPNNFGYCRDEQNFGFTCTISNLINAKSSAYADSAVFSYLKYVMWEQGKQFMFSPQFAQYLESAAKTSKEEIEKMLDDVETRVVTRDGLKELLRADISSPQIKNSTVDTYEVNNVFLIPFIRFLPKKKISIIASVLFFILH
jgi:hypothetical protein